MALATELTTISVTTSTTFLQTNATGGQIASSNVAIIILRAFTIAAIVAIISIRR